MDEHHPAIASTFKAQEKMTLPGPEVDVKLIATDMDGTLLREDGTLPDGFWDTYKRLEKRNIPFIPASGRQLFTLQHLFGEHSERMSFIAENGNMVVLNNEIVAATVMDADLVSAVEHTVKRIGRDLERDIGLVVCGHKSAYTERTDQRFLNEVRRYYHELAIVPDMTSIPDKVLKLAIFDFDDISEVSSEFEKFKDRASVVVSSENWIDVMDPSVNKGVAIRAIQKAFGIDAANTAAFGDYLNDVEMLQSCGISFAMENGHADVKKAAKYIAPPNSNSGVLTCINSMLGLSKDAEVADNAANAVKGLNV